MLQVAPTTVPTSLLAERQEKHTEDSGRGLTLHQEEHDVWGFFSLQAMVALSWIRSDGLEWLQELSANIYTAARSDSSNLSGMLWQFLAATMRTAGHATTGSFKVETWSLIKRHRDCIIFYRIGSKHSEDKVLTVPWRLFTLLHLLVQFDATVFSHYIGVAALRWTENKASVRVISGVDWAGHSVTPLDLYLSSWLKKNKNKNLDNPDARSSSNFTVHWRHPLSHENRTLNRNKIRHNVKHNEIAENVEKQCTHHSKGSAKDVRNIIITISATRDVFLRHYSHVWRSRLCIQDDHSKQWLSNFLGHFPEFWHLFLNFVMIKRKETTVTGCAGHSPCVKKRTTRFEPAGDACRGLDENGWGHGRNKPSDYLHNQREGKPGWWLCPRHGHAAQIPGHRCPLWWHPHAGAPTAPKEQLNSHRTLRGALTTKGRWTPLDALRPWAQVTHKLRGLNRQLLFLLPAVPLALRELPWSSPCCRQQPGGAEGWAEGHFQHLLLEQANWEYMPLKGESFTRCNSGKTWQVKAFMPSPPHEESMTHALGIHKGEQKCSSTKAAGQDWWCCLGQVNMSLSRAVAR